jgi:hypothetical protein
MSPGEPDTFSLVGQFARPAFLPVARSSQCCVKKWVCKSVHTLFACCPRDQAASGDSNINASLVCSMICSRW